MTRLLAPSTLLAGLALALVATPLDAQRPGRRGGSGIEWAADGRTLQVGDKFVDPTDLSEVAPVAPAAPAADPRAAAVQAFAAAYGKEIPRTVLSGTRARSTLPRQPIEDPGLEITADGAHAALVIDGVLWAWSEGGEARKVAEGLAGVRRFDLAPNGSAVSYLDGYDLKVTRLADGKTFEVSTDGSEDLFYGELDWVYQEEVYGRFDFEATWWSPDGAHLAFLRIEESGVDTFTVIDHTEKTLEVELLKYPKAGTINPRASLHVTNPGDGKSVAIDLSAYPASDEILIVRVDWTPEADRCVFMVQDREQTWLDLVFANPADGSVRTVLRETCDDGWVNRLPMPRWLDDGSFLWESERTGFKHLYRYDRNGKLLATVTHGEWEMGGIARLDEAKGEVIVTGTQPGYAIGASAWHAKLDGSAQTLLTPEKASHSIQLNGDGTLFVDTWQTMSNPGEVWLRSVANPTEGVRKLAARSAPEGLNLPVHEQIEARDGEILDVAYTLPSGFDPSKTYPVWINTYSGPDAPTIRDSFRPSRPSDWYVLLQVNVRSASGRGMKYTKQCYRQFGVQELKDIEDAVDWICKNEWADASRVGITGWSYGGFMTAFALTHSKKFRCGIAGAGVYDWELYDTIYTERYMATPQHNPEGYAASSVVKAAKDLTGQLLIVHGTMDDNVHLQNAVMFVDELQKAGKMNFEMMIYPRSRHGVGSPHLQALREEFMRKYL